MAGYVHVCACCRATVHAPVWDIAQPASGKSVAVCRVCAGHIALRADGLVWFPDHCPAPASRPALSVVRRGEED